MKNILDFIKKHNNSIKLLTSAIFTLIVIVLFITSVYGWYVSSSSTSASSISASSESSNIHLREYIEIKRYFVSDSTATQQSDTLYKREDNTNDYYEYDSTTSSFKLDDDKKKIPMSFDSLFPNEYLDVTLWYYPDEKFNESNYSIRLTNFTDSNGTFSETYTDSDKKEITISHSVLGVYRVGELKDDKISSWNWLCTYNGDYEEDTRYDYVSFKSGSFKNETPQKINEKDYYTTTFRIEFSLVQLQEKITKVSTNALSEKEVSIGSIRITA